MPTVNLTVNETRTLRHVFAEFKAITEISILDLHREGYTEIAVARENTLRVVEAIEQKLIQTGAVAHLYNHTPKVP
jgi:hypothetical protein